MTTRTPDFSICLGEVNLTVDEIWPDGDAPENPTAEDVAKLMRGVGRHRVVTDWNLLTDIEVFGNHDASRAVV